MVIESGNSFRKMQRYQFNYNVLKRVRLEKVIDPEVVETAGMFLEEEYTARTDPVRDPATKNIKRVQRRLNSDHAEDKKSTRLRTVP